jgi:2-dehydro-3-deoxygluconokinase
VNGSGLNSRLNIAPRSARAFDLIVLGECMVELYASAPLGQAHTLEKAFGGDVLNSLVSASRLGSRTAFITRVGDDPFGAGLLEAWQSEGIDTSHAPLVPGENGVYFISLQPSGEREFTYRRAGSAASQLSSADIDEAFIASSRMLLLSGITQAISPTAQAATLEAARLARQHGVIVAFDPNFRAKLWATRGGMDAARAAFLEVAPFVDVLLPSHPDDVNFIVPNAPGLDLPTICERLQGDSSLMALKCGARGAWLRMNGRPLEVPTLNARVVDTTGAGDAWNGAFLCGLLHDIDPIEAARFAHRVAARKLEHRGAIAPRTAFTSLLTATPEVAGGIV